MFEVELLQGLAGRESGRPDADLPAVGLASGHLPLQTGSQKLLVGPTLRASPFGQPLIGLRQGRGLQRPAQVGEIARRLGLGRHHATPKALS